MEQEPCQESGDSIDWREQYLLRKLARLRAQQEKCRLDILSAENALAYLRGQGWPDPPEVPP